MSAGNRRAVNSLLFNIKLTTTESLNLMTNKTILITGASTGIGKCCALHLDQQGFKVFAGVRKLADGEALQNEASASLQPILVDVTDTASIKQAVETITAEVGVTGLSGLVNNAGIAVAGPLEFLPVDEIRHQFEVNVFGQLAVTQACLPLLRQSTNGRIVNMSSMSGKIALPFVGPYSASKFALEAFSDSMRLELRRWGITVSIIEPGAIKTPIWQKTVKSGMEILNKLPPKAYEFYGSAIKKVPQILENGNDRGIPPEKVALAVAHALTTPTPKVRYIVGNDARFAIGFAWLTPYRLRDWLVSGRR
ncbi:SDR family oxidoreductase [Anaerolineales bacterium HSG25]|nr:SDR family oxidoreductase [Anaerolineales bacterium HSG25]